MTCLSRADQWHRLRTYDRQRLERRETTLGYDGFRRVPLAVRSERGIASQTACAHNMSER